MKSICFGLIVAPSPPRRSCEEGETGRSTTVKPDASRTLKAPRASRRDFEPAADPADLGIPLGTKPTQQETLEQKIECFAHVS